MAKNNLIRFDWAIKRLLRNKANFVVLEGFLSELLEENIRIRHILESEGNKTDETDKFNRVDILAENSKNELIIVEVQNTRELYYFQRMLYGVSKAITEYISQGDEYSEIRKLYSINIVYFDLGQGKDYIYHGKTDFLGIHLGDTLRLSTKQRNTFVRENAGDVFSEYYVIRVNEFNKHAISPVDEWVEYLKTGDISETAKAKGLPEAREKLRVDNMSKEEQTAYNRHFENLRIQWDVLTTAHEEGKDEGWLEGKLEGKLEGIKEGKLEVQKKIVKCSAEEGLLPETISKITGLAVDEIKKILKEN